MSVPKRTPGVARTGKHIQVAFKSAIDGALQRKLIEARGTNLRRAKTR